MTINDWDLWIQLRRSFARAHDIWRYCDPSKSPGDIPKLREPSMPTIGDVKIIPAVVAVPAPEGGVAIEAAPEREALMSELDADEREEYQWLKQQYLRKYKEWETKKKAMAQLIRDIEESVDIGYLPNLEPDETAYAMLYRLQQRYAPTDLAREKQVIKAWGDLFTGKPKGDIDAWLNEWERIYNRGQTLEIGEIMGMRAVERFIDALEIHISPEFASVWRVSLADEKFYIDFLDLLEQFRRFWRSRSTLPKARGRHGAFVTSFDEPASAANPQLNKNGKRSEREESRHKDKPCLCGEIHLFKECPYLIESKRPKGWKGDTVLQEEIDSTIKRSVALRKAVLFAQDEARRKNSNNSAGQGKSQRDLPSES